MSFRKWYLGFDCVRTEPEVDSHGLMEIQTWEVWLLTAFLLSP